MLTLWGCWLITLRRTEVELFCVIGTFVSQTIRRGSSQSHKILTTYLASPLKKNNIIKFNKWVRLDFPRRGGFPTVATKDCKATGCWQKCLVRNNPLKLQHLWSVITIRPTTKCKKTKSKQGIIETPSNTCEWCILLSGFNWILGTRKPVL